MAICGKEAFSITHTADIQMHSNLQQAFANQVAAKLTKLFINKIPASASSQDCRAFCDTTIQMAIFLTSWYHSVLISLITIPVDRLSLRSLSGAPRAVVESRGDRREEEMRMQRRDDDGNFCHFEYNSIKISVFIYSILTPTYALC
jgi:hypothetical protein